MKKVLFFVFISIFCNSNIKGQNWAMPGATWYYSDNSTWFSGYYKIEKKGDSLINNTICDNFLTTEYGYSFPFGGFTTVNSNEFTYVSN